MDSVEGGPRWADWSIHPAVPEERLTTCDYTRTGLKARGNWQPSRVLREHCAHLKLPIATMDCPHHPVTLHCEKMQKMVHDLLPVGRTKRELTSGRKSLHRLVINNDQAGRMFAEPLYILDDFPDQFRILFYVAQININIDQPRVYNWRKPQTFTLKDRQKT